MSVAVIDGGNIACLYCTTTDTAFGPVVGGAIEAEAFLDWVTTLHGDPRDIREDRLVEHYQAFQAIQHAEQQVAA